MKRYGKPFKKTKEYFTRIGVYGIITVGKNLLLTEQNGKEIQLPGGGVDKGEQILHTLVRESFEETGWKIQPIRRLGVFQRYAFMEEYNLWAHKIAHIYHCRGIYPIDSDLEEGHIPIIASPEQAKKILEDDGNRDFVKKFFKFKCLR